MILYEIFMKYKIKKYDVISFDIFDTLIHRRTMFPWDIFGNVEEKLKKSGINEQFKEKRIIAEKEARIAANGKEIIIEDIYKKYRLSEIDSRELMQMELDEERLNVYPDQKMMNILNKAKKENKRIILISDMYLDENFIINLLDLCGCEGYDKIYLSSSVGYRKHDGSLFQYVRENENGNIIHIADNFKSDYKMARKNGVDSLWLPVPYIKRLFFGRIKN